MASSMLIGKAGDFGYLSPIKVLEEYVTSKDHFRVSFEAIPQRPAFKNLEREEESIAAMRYFNDMALESQVLEILRSGHGITSIFSDFNRLASRLTANPIERDTFAIDTADKKVSKWKAAAAGDPGLFGGAQHIQKCRGGNLPQRILLREGLSCFRLRPSDPRCARDPSTQNHRRGKGELEIKVVINRIPQSNGQGETLEEHKLPTVVQFVLPETSYDFTDLKGRLRSIIRLISLL